jgi:hypothetical protein
MERLLGGKATRTDGRLAKANLHVEAGVSRATMNRATAVMAEWDAAVITDTKARDPRLVEVENTISELKHRLAKVRQTNTELERKNRAAVTVIAELNVQLLAARGAEPTGTITPIERGRRVPRSARHH